MPLFEYRCRSCHREFELLVQPSDTAQCPQCQSADLEKKLSVFAVASEHSTAQAPEMPCAGCPSQGSGRCGFEH
ncbi:MAG: zinc ribbon domain-containing protein [Deltaproteobacteria bacterium]|nr:zinc ribbon domain-containing protein [Deltaproteobacteria bacterium]